MLLVLKLADRGQAGWRADSSQFLPAHSGELDNQLQKLSSEYIGNDAERRLGIESHVSGHVKALCHDSVLCILYMGPCQVLESPPPPPSCIRAHGSVACSVMHSVEHPRLGKAAKRLSTIVSVLCMRRLSTIWITSFCAIHIQIRYSALSVL